ncbi:DMT family transporter [Streptomyces acidiscabies]
MPTFRMAALALLWGSAFLWIKLALDHGLTPVQITVGRCALGAAVLLALAWRAGQRLPRTRRVWGHLVVAALFCNAVPFALFSLGQRTVDSGTAGVMNATTPLWSLVIGMLLGSAERRRVSGLVLGFGGVLLVFAPWQSGGALLSWDALFLLGAGASYAVAFAYMARTLTPNDAPLAVSAAQLLTATAWSGLAVPFAGPVKADVTGLLALLALGVLATGVTFYLNYQMIAEEGPTSAATVGYLLPVVSLTLGALLLDEPLTPRVLAGMVVILAGVSLTRRRTAPRQLPSPAAWFAGKRPACPPHDRPRTPSTAPQRRVP